MSSTAGSPSKRPGRLLFAIGWWVLLVLTVLFALNHLVGIWGFSSSDDEQMMFIAYAALQVLAVLVLLFPYRQREMWAWWAMWVPIAPMLATLPAFGSELGILYSAVGLAMALAQFATLPGFRAAADPARD